MCYDEREFRTPKGSFTFFSNYFSLDYCSGPEFACIYIYIYMKKVSTLRPNNFITEETKKDANIHKTYRTNKYHKNIFWKHYKA